MKMLMVLIMSIILSKTAWASCNETHISIDPSSAMAEALKVAQGAIHSNLPGEYSISEAQVGLGKYSKGFFGDYTINLSVYPESMAKNCHVSLRIEKMTGPKNPEDIILASGTTGELIIAKILYAACN